MKRFGIGTALLLALLLLLAAFCACSGGKKDEETTGENTTAAETGGQEDTTTAEETTAAEETTGGTEPGKLEDEGNLFLSAFTVYCPADAPAWERNAAKALVAAIADRHGVTLALNTDAGQRTEGEILVGRYALEESLRTADYAKLGCNGYAVFTAGTKVIVTATMDAGYTAAAAALAEKAEKDGEILRLAKDCALTVEEHLSTVTPDANRHLRVDLADVNAGYDVYQVPASHSYGYRYGPSIIVNPDGSMDAWFATTGHGTQWDWISYRHSEDGKTWSEEKIVLQPTPNGLDHWSCCDPGVIYFNGYYYLGYTSTINKNQKDNCVFVARSENPDGPFEKWNGNGWGGDQPQPIVYFDEETELWGAGEPSFVELNGTLYIYYTWDGSDGRKTYVSTADATDVNWPATMTFRGEAVGAGTNDSIDVKYVEEYGKFLAICTDQRLGANSYLLFLESDDGLTFVPMQICKKNVIWYCHNSGMSGTRNGHIAKDTPTFAGYAYGEGWGIWNTRFQDITVSLGDQPDLSEKNGQNQHLASARDGRASDQLEPIAITAKDNEILRVSASNASVRLKIYRCTTFQDAWTTLSSTEMKDVTYTDYDPNVVECVDGTAKIRVVGVGRTVVTVHWKGMITYVCVIVVPDQSTDLESLTPLIRDSFVLDRDMTASYLPQIKGIARYADGSFAEVYGDMATYTGYDAQVVRVDAKGILHAVANGETDVTVTMEGKSFTVHVKVIGKEAPRDYTDLTFEDGSHATDIIKPGNNTELSVADGALKLTPTKPSDPFVYLNYGTAGYDAADYVSLTLTYMIPKEASAKSFTGQIFFCTGADTSPAESRSQKYTLIADGEWHTVTVRLADKPGWQGVINQIRLDYFDSCKEGDVMYIRSIVLDSVA